MPPLVVVVQPSNDNPPSVTLATGEVLRIETSPPTSTMLFSGLTILDRDDSPCNQQLLAAAQVVIETVAEDSDNDILEVRIANKSTLRFLQRI